MSVVSPSDADVTQFSETPASDARPEPGSIVITRHGRPALDRDLTFGWRSYKVWWGKYDAGGLAADQAPPEELVETAAKADVIFSSPLKRSLETAEAIAPGREIVTDPVFVEAALPPPPVPGLRLRPGHWGVFARIAWWFGYSGGLESRIEAEHRAEAAADKLVATAETGKNVVLCAHGWFNRMLRPALLARGWSCVRDGRDHYWSYRCFEKR
jgi:broad specificity phosphatase PhoE